VAQSNFDEFLRERATSLPMMIVYQIYDRAGALLDIGLTRNTYVRLLVLADVKPWWQEVASIQLERFSSDDAASERTRQIALREHPRYLSFEYGAPAAKPPLN
jgi:hypothetical protein